MIKGHTKKGRTNGSGETVLSLSVSERILVNVLFINLGQFFLLISFYFEICVHCKSKVVKSQPFYN